MISYYLKGLENFVDQVIPIILEIGIFLRDYEGDKLRKYLGLKQPQSKRVNILELVLFHMYKKY